MRNIQTKQQPGLFPPKCIISPLSPTFIVSFLPQSLQWWKQPTHPPPFFFSEENLVQTKKCLGYAYRFVCYPPQIKALNFWICSVRLFFSLIKNNDISFLECSRVSWHPKSHSQQNLHTSSETLKYFFFLFLFYLEKRAQLLFFPIFIIFPVCKLCCAKKK